MDPSASPSGSLSGKSCERELPGGEDASITSQLLCVIVLLGGVLLLLRMTLLF